MDSEARAEVTLSARLEKQHARRQRQSNTTAQLHSTHVMRLTPVPAHKTTWRHDIRTTSNPARAKRWTPDARALRPVWEMSAVQMAGIFYLVGSGCDPSLRYAARDISSINMAAGWGCCGRSLADCGRDAKLLYRRLIIGSRDALCFWSDAEVEQKGEKEKKKWEEK